MAAEAPAATVAAVEGSVTADHEAETATGNAAGKVDVAETSSAAEALTDVASPQASRPTSPKAPPAGFLAVVASTAKESRAADVDSAAAKEAAQRVRAPSSMPGTYAALPPAVRELVEVSMHAPDQSHDQSE